LLIIKGINVHYLISYQYGSAPYCHSPEAIPMA